MVFLVPLRSIHVLIYALSPLPPPLPPPPAPSSVLLLQLARHDKEERAPARAGARAELSRPVGPRRACGDPGPLPEVEGVGRAAGGGDEDGSADAGGAVAKVCSLAKARVVVVRG